MIRSATVKGRFYPATEIELHLLIDSWKRERAIPGVRAAIVPHAGYVFSGECAWRGLTSLDWSEFERVVLVGPSHRFPFSGFSIYKGDSFETVAQSHPNDIAFVDELGSTLNIPYIEQAHYEHSTEVQIPLIHAIAPSLPIVECIYGERSELKMQQLIHKVLSTPRTALLISSDLSHYYTEDEARVLDDHIIEAIETGDLDELLKGEACGMVGIRSLISFAYDQGRRLSTIDYRTSADAPMGDKTRVVGYLSAIMR